MLTPLVRLTLYCGLGHSEFSATVRRVFIEVASDDYGLRGRPANVSKISAKTGLSRKSIQKVRAELHSPDWSPDDEVSPINTISHYWRFDEEFGSKDGTPKELAYEGDGGFSALVRKYGGDIPASTIREVFLREGLAIHTAGGLLKLVRDFSFPESLDEDFLRNAAFAIGNHAETLFHNALMADSGMVTAQDHQVSGRFERYAWSRRLGEADISAFQSWVRDKGDRFIWEADAYISRCEANSEHAVTDASKVAGVGVYFFRGR
jgi:Family of unknown function (DUF6502)